MTKSTTIRIILTTIIVIALFIESNLYFHTLSIVLIFILSVFDVWERHHQNNMFSEGVYYLSWVMVVAAILHARGSCFGPFTPLFWMALIKISTASCYLIKYKSLIVTRSILTKIWLLSLALYGIELIANTTHALSNYALCLAIISSIESLIILMLEKERLVYKASLLNFLWKKNN